MKNVVVSDSTPLIYLAKINKLINLKNLFNQIIIPEIIYEEVIVNGKEEIEIPIIEKLIEEKYIIIKKTTKKQLLPNLDKGEIEAISLCKELKIKDILIDESDGFDTAKMLNLNPIRSTSILLKLLAEKYISYKEFKDSLIQLSEEGYYLSANTYQKLLDKGEEYQ